MVEVGINDPLPDTQSQQPLSQILNGEGKDTAWGHLLPCIPSLPVVALTCSTTKFGRATTNDIKVSEENYPKTQFLNVSKEHFVIKADASNVVLLEDLSKNGTYVNEVLVGKHKSYVLDHDDEISIGLCFFKVFVFKLSEEPEDRFLPQQLKKKYKVCESLGHGACGEVRLVIERATCKKFAIKKIIKGNFSTNSTGAMNHPKKIRNEVNILNSLSHPCIIRMHEFVETNDEVFIILEYMEGGELTGRIHSEPRMSEDQIKFIFYQIVNGVQYLHYEGITHRDLKPANVLLASDKMETLVKISDFGISKIMEETFMETICGTLHYTAPEILNGKYECYDKQVDIWSLGVILYYMLLQELPFAAPDSHALKIAIIKGQYKTKSEMWNKISPPAKDLIARMLTVNPICRIGIHDIIAHSWFQDRSMETKFVEIGYNNQGSPLRFSESVIRFEESSSDYSEAPSKKICLESRV